MWVKKRAAVKGHTQDREENSSMPIVYTQMHVCKHTYAHMPTCSHTHTHPHNDWHSEDALLICWLTEFNGEPNTMPLTNSAEQHRERENTGMSLQGGMQKRARWTKRRINDLTPMFEKKGKCVVSAAMWPTFRCPGAFLSCAEQITK